MAEEFQGGVSFGETWWNLSKNLFGLPLPCSSGANDVADFDWPSQAMKASEDNCSIALPPPDSSMSTFGGNYPLQLQPLNSISTSNDFPLNNISPSYNSYTESLLQTLFDTDNFDPAQLPSLDHNQQTMNNFPSYDQMNVNSHDLNVPSFSSTRVPNTHVKRVNEDPGDSGSVATKKGNDEGGVKRARIVTPSPLPTFKVRKEKLGDRVTALQQLVSPFGKTDTASVLHEAIEYIKFLHDQVSVLSTPYLKNGSHLHQHRQVPNKVNDQEERPIRDLKARGLCLVPISSTFPVTAETSTDFWSPIFGDCFK
ncbi:basic helix-loop-helix (bHLH) DNA-bindingsuperfamily protein [Striga asiatica]|uniref:Basic helix-loop-helix (BHLH) DNA-bindingsuperfamily protein n=1 Tax=Striga asiatica TaxID=4170 RepID=A0A5A7R9I4_STRAF|nr:basic helix-loop-helix (bHLH) DNA-bindingsuperfamily protein [Striga asiatica]